MGRTLSGVERTVWKRGAISLNIVVAASLDGVVTIAALQKAWQILQGKHALLRTHLVVDGHAVLLVTDGTCEIPVREVAATSLDEGAAEMACELETPFKLSSREPLLRSVLLSSPSRVQLILTCHHCLFDGLAVTTLLRDVLFCLAGQEERVSSTAASLPMADLLPAAVRLPWLATLSVKTLNLLFARLNPVVDVDPIPMGKNAILSWRLDVAQTHALREACRQNEVSVHAAVMALFQAAQHKVQGDGQKFRRRNYTPVSVRQRLAAGVGDAVGLYAGEAYVPCPYVVQKGFWENARRFHRNLQANSTDGKLFRPMKVANGLCPGVLDRLLLYRYRKQRLQFGYVISNLGCLDFPGQYGPLTLQEVHGPVIYVPRAEKTLTLLTVGGRLAFTCIYRPAIIDVETIQSLKDEGMRLLMRYTGLDINQNIIE